ncbi:MAG: hypothetical protein QXT10_02595 [Candidatus Bathyarchaeia archaeon]
MMVSGCAYAGIINTILHVKQITGSSKIHAVIDGFHLSGKECEEQIDKTVEMLKNFNPDIIVPMHCTGWRAAFAIAEAIAQSLRMEQCWKHLHILDWHKHVKGSSHYSNQRLKSEVFEICNPKSWSWKSSD